MANDEVFEWSVPRLSIHGLMMPESRRPFIMIAVLCTSLFLILGVYLAVENKKLEPFYFMLMIAGGALVALALAIALVLAIMWAAGSGYSYRLDANGLSTLFCFGRSRHPAPRIPPGGDSVEAEYGAFNDGWIRWSRLRTQEAKMEANEKNLMIVLRAGTRHNPNQAKIPAICLVCTDRNHFAKIEQFIRERLG